MKIIVENATKLVKYVGNNIELHADHTISNNGSRNNKINSSNATLYEVDRGDLEGKGNWYTYDDGVYILTPTGQAGLDTLAAQAQVEADEGAMAQAKRDHIFANLTAEQGRDYIETNVSDLATAKTALKRIIEFVIYNRNN